MNAKEITKKLKTYADLEEKYALRLENIRGLGNDYVEMLINSIGYDSKKHAGLYRAAADIIEGKNMGLMATKMENLEKELNEHIKVEKEMMKNVKDVIKQVDNEKAKVLLKVIEEDERAHHPLMKKILESVLKPEILEDQDVWMMMFGLLPRHGHALDPYADIHSQTPDLE
jgi:rubrerythrin